MIMVSLATACESELAAARVVEVYSRIMTGLAFDGAIVTLNVQNIEDDTTVGSEDQEAPS